MALMSWLPAAFAFGFTGVARLALELGCAEGIGSIGLYKRLLIRFFVAKAGK